MPKRRKPRPAKFDPAVYPSLEVLEAYKQKLLTDGKGCPSDAALDAAADIMVELYLQSEMRRQSRQARRRR